MPYSIIALACAFAAAASAAEWFFIAALSAAMKKDISILMRETRFYKFYVLISVSSTKAREISKHSKESGL
jgi:hypothetical protein